MHDPHALIVARNWASALAFNAIALCGYAAITALYW
jgi:hypothetical protein